MTSRARGAGESPWWISGVLLLGVMVAVDVVLERQINGAYGGAAVLTAIYADVRRTAVVAVLALVMSVASGTWNDNLGERDWAIRFATCVLICGLALLAARGEPPPTASDSCARLRWPSVSWTRSRWSSPAPARSGRSPTGSWATPMGTMGATSAMVLSLDADDVLRTISWHGRSGTGADQYQEVPLSSDLPGAVAVREGRDVHSGR